MSTNQIQRSKDISVNGSTPYTEDELHVAVANCSAAPVHIPESIQGFGALLVCDIGLKKILRASANTQEFLDIAPNDLIGANPAILLTREELHGLRNRMGHPTISTQREVLTSRLLGAVETQITVHVRDGMAILEFIPEMRRREDRVDLFEQARTFLTMPLDEKNLIGFLEDATKRMRAINGYDRVKFYRFLPDNSGEVVAESTTLDMTSYLGQRFPESDIPTVARDLYVKTPFRALHNIQADDIPILGGEGEAALDMSLAALRGVDRVHRQFLKNMNVGGTLSVSVVVDGALWGLFASHNRKAKPVDPSMLLAAELAGKLISLRIQHAIDTRRQFAKRDCMEIANKFLAVDDNALAMKTYWQRTQDDLMGLFPCDGIAIMVGREISCFGDSPSTSALNALFSMAPQSHETPFMTDNLRAITPGINWGKTAGALVLSFLEGTTTKVAFLRNLAETQIEWAGSPKKDVAKDANGLRLDPRNSFETYIERVQGRSLEWTADDIETGQALHTALKEAFATQNRLSGNRHRLGVKVRELNHRVRNILALVQSISVYSRENATSFAAYTESLEQRIVALAGAHNLLTRADMEGALLQDILHFELKPFTGSGRIKTRGPNIAFRPEAVSVIALLIHELATNAVKHGALSVSEGQVCVSWAKKSNGLELIWQERGGPTVKTPETPGFGLSMIEDAISYEFTGEAHLDFDPAGIKARFWLPRCTMADAAFIMENQQEAEKLPIPATKRSGLKGLVVEDNFIVSKITEQMLMAEGFDHVDRAASVEESLKLQENGRYDLCLLDLDLRGQISISVAQSLEQKGIPFILTTGYDSEGHDAIESFNAPTLTKPFDPETLRKTIAQMELSA
ncbi:MAG: HWE histidine kinase domain-containing protein [Pseudomonadota bacterium]